MGELSSFRLHRRALLNVGAAALCAEALPRSHAAGDTQAQQLLAASDQVRNPPGSFSVKVALTEYRSSKPTASSTLVVYARPAESSGQYNNLVRIVSPARDENKLILRNGLDMWFYDPASRASVRISPQQRLLGQASNNDVMSTNLAKDYDAVHAGTETITGADAKPVACVRLTLTAQRPDVAYPHVDYWIDEARRLPVKAQFLTAEKRLLKTAYFRRYQVELGRERPTETVIIDGLDPAWVTVMRLSGYAAREVPAAWLQREFLPRFSAEL